MTQLLIILAIVAMAILAWKIWKPIVQPPKQEVPPNEARIYLFYTEWCGFSQKAMPEWAKLEKTLAQGGYFGKTHVTAVKVDAEQDRKLASLYGIHAYPTVVLETETASHDFDKRVTYDNLMQFLRGHLGQERTSL